MAEKKKIIKSRAFWFIVYLDSVKGGADFRQELEKYHIPFVISPLHDKDTLPDGTLKKPHYHIMLVWDNTTTTTKANEIVEDMKGVRPPQDNLFACSSVSSCARYLIHRDNADKFQYDSKDVYCYGGLDYLELCASVSDEREQLKQMKKFIIKHRVVSFALFSSYCDDNRVDWSRLVNTRYSYLVKEFQKSLQWSLEKSYNTDKSISYNKIIDFETGDILYTLFD